MTNLSRCVTEDIQARVSPSDFPRTSRPIRDGVSPIVASSIVVRLRTIGRSVRGVLPVTIERERNAFSSPPRYGSRGSRSV